MSEFLLSEAAVGRLHGLLFPVEAESGLHTYAILDGASVPGLLARLASLKADYACLYRGELEADVAEVAPYLVRLPPESPLTDWILREGWGEHWGVFALASVSFEVLRRHLRTILRVKDPAGRTLYFRYYDPRVLAVFLPTCRRDELRAMFGPVERFLVETEDREQALVLSCGVTKAVLALEPLRPEPDS